MSDDFSILLAFHAQLGPEAMGHGETQLTSQMAKLIQRFIDGESTDDEKRELSQFLMQNPERIRWIAERIKLSRDDSRQTA